MIIQRGYVVVGRAALVVAILVTALCTAVAAVFSVEQLVDAVNGRAVLTVPTLTNIEPGRLGPGVEWARYSGVTMFVTDAADATPLLASAAVLALGSILASGVALVILCLSLLRSRPFGAAVIAAWFAAALVTVAYGAGGPLLRARAIELIVHALPAPTPSDLVGRGDWALYVANEVAPLPLLVGGALTVVAVALTIARRLRRDTEGIV